jgi:hypothetical protein
MDCVFSTWGPKIFDADAVTKLFIENATAKALDPSSYSGHSRLICIWNILLNTWKGLGITSVLHSNAVLKQAIDFFQTNETAAIDSISDSSADSKIKSTQNVS